MRKLYSLVIWSLLITTSSMMAMFCCCAADDEDEQSSQELDANPILQKMIVASLGNEKLYQYDPSYSRWKLSQIIYLDSQGNYCCRIYVKLNGQVQVHKKDGVLLETITPAAHDELDLKDNGKFVTGSGQ